MSDFERGQVSTSAAEVYDRFFVPALFSQWTDVVLEVADVRAGHRVLDVGCGTGVLARAARTRGGADVDVTGVDPNDGMLAVARRAEPHISWCPGVAESLGFPDQSFDRTVSQFALMFFSDPTAALVEMSRVTRPQGRMAIAVWDGLESNVGYARLSDLVEDLFGSDAAGALRAPFSFGDASDLAHTAAAGITAPEITRHRGIARFTSLEGWLHAEIRGWTLADTVDDDGLARLVAEAGHRLADLVTEQGIAFDVSALVVSGPPA